MVFGNGFPFPVTWVVDALSSLNGSLASTGAGDEIHNNKQWNSFMVSQLGNRGFVGWFGGRFTLDLQGIFGIASLLLNSWLMSFIIMSVANLIQFYERTIFIGT